MNAIFALSAALDVARVAWYVRDVQRRTFEPSLEYYRRKGGAYRFVGPARQAAETLVRHGVFGKLVRIVRAAARRGSTVWLLGRDCDVIFVALRELGYENVRYLHGIDRRLAGERPHVVRSIARRLVRPRDVVVDTGYSGTIVRMFVDAAGAIGVILSSHKQCERCVVRLDVGLDKYDKQEVYDAIAVIEDMKTDLFDASRANQTVHLPYRTVERWIVDGLHPGTSYYQDEVFRYLDHMAFAFTFVRSVVDLMKDVTPAVNGQQV